MKQMQKRSPNITMSRYTRVSSNKVDHEIIQRKLEGRCILCGEYLPKHNPDCIDHPVNTAIRTLESIKHNLQAAQDFPEDYVDSLANIRSAEELQDIIKPYKGKGTEFDV